MVMSMTPLEATRSRLFHQQILHPSLEKPGTVVTTIGAMQAQDYTGALWSIGLRMPGATVTDILQAIADRDIVRTWLIRGTLHFVAARDLRWILGLVSPRLIAGSAGRHRQLGLTGEDFSRSREIFAAELKGGRQLARDELYRLLGEAGVSPDGQRGYHLLWMAGLEGLICFGNHRGNQPTFVLLDEWISPGLAFGQEEALAGLATRYFTGHGPATLQDFAWWSGLKVADAKKGIEAAGTALSQVTIGGREYFTDPETPDLTGGGQEAYLLPGFDEYILGYRDRNIVLDPSLAGRIVIGENGMMLPTIIIEGKVAGRWKRIVGKREIIITLHPFSSMSPAHKREVGAAAERYGKFMRMPVNVEW